MNHTDTSGIPYHEKRGTVEKQMRHNEKRIRALEMLVDHLSEELNRPSRPSNNPQQKSSSNPSSSKDSKSSRKPKSTHHSSSRHQSSTKRG